MNTASWYHASLKPIGRSAGRSAVACAAYRTGTSMTDKFYGPVRDFTHKSDVVTHFTLAPEGSPPWAFDAEQLWNAVEARETHVRAQLAAEWEIALPNELEPDEREAIARRFSQWLVDEYGVAVTTGIHEGGSRGNGKNDHCHVMMELRPLDAGGWAGNKIRDFNSRPGKENPNVTYVRKQIAEFINEALEDAGSDTRVDYRSYRERGLDHEPTLHLGPAATALERAGLDGGDRAAINREIIEERLRWQMEQGSPEITPDIERELSQRWDDWQPLQRGADAMAEAPPLERGADASALRQAAPLERGVAEEGGEEAPPRLVRGAPATTDEAHTGWRRFVDRVRAFGATFQTKAVEFLHDESSGAPEAQRGFVTRLFDTGFKLFGGLKHEELPELAEGIEQATELAADMTEKRAGEAAPASDADASSGDGARPPVTFAERLKRSAADLLRNERGMVPDDPGDAFDRAAAAWAQAPPHDEGPPAHAPVEPATPERDGPDIE
jgi:hypothetical protein